MSHDETLARLDDWAGGELPLRERREVDLHLEACPACRAEADALLALLARAEELPREIAPERDLWDGIASRLEPRGATTGYDEAEGADEMGGAAVVHLPSRRVRVPWWLLSAAALVLMAVSSGATFAFMRRHETQVLASAPAASLSSASRGAALVAFRPAEAEYQRAVGDLTLLLNARRKQLSPETAAVIDRNLRIIDEAIRQSRAALEKDPNNRELAQMLSSVYDTKVETLQRAVQI
jgi:hypothetical protein